MLIGKQYKIEADSLNIILYRKKKRLSKEGKEGWERMGYFATVPNALRGLVNQEVRDTDLKDMKTIVNKLNELEGLIKTLPQRPTAIQ